MKDKILRRWIWIGTAQLFVSLILAVIAPFLINSRFPIVGLLIWLVIIAAFAASLIHVVRCWLQAARCRQRFLQQFPNQQFSVLEFLGIPQDHLEDRLNQYALAEADPDFRSLEISPLAFVRGGLR